MSDSQSEETPTQRQARLRREKRNAKIQSGGSDRLAKITQGSGRIAPAEPTAAPPQPTAAPDPDEVDISEHHWTPPSRSQQLEILRAQQGRQDPFSEFRSQPVSSDGAADPNADPMMAMMQQMMGGGGFPGMNSTNDPNGGMPELPPFMKAMMGGAAQTQQEQAQPKSDTAYVWRILHAVFALTLALYITIANTFNGSKLSRAQVMDENAGPNLFYIFATAELILQSTRYFLEKGQLQGSGWIAMIANSGFVPPPYVDYLRVLGRYMTIWQTVVADATTIIFVVGALAWWKGMAAN